MATARHWSAAVALVSKSLDRANRTVRARVTFPERDRQGDYVEPAGISWVQRPKVDWDHDVPIGWASIETTDLVHKGKSYPIPFGTTHFARTAADFAGVDRTAYDRSGRPVGQYPIDDCLYAAEQVWELIASDQADGVSIEFLPDKQHTRIVSKSLDPTSGRYPSDFLKVRAVGYAHCFEPVNDFARILKNVPAHIERRIVLAQTGRIAGSPLHATIKKSLAPYAELARSLPRSVQVEKSMNPEDLEPLPLPDASAAPMGDEMGMEPEAQPSRGRPSIEVGLDLAQGLKDLKAAAEEKLGTSDDPKAIAAYRKLLVDLDACAEDCAALSSKHEAKLTSLDSGGDEPVEGEGDGEGEDADPEPIETDDDGAIKTKSLYTPLRFRPVGKGGRPIAPVYDHEAAARVAAYAEREAERQATLSEIEAELRRGKTSAIRADHKLKKLSTNYPTGR